ncbi:MAG: hypothetical protein AAFU55_13655 [Pseudomonadota bacterium]
MKKIVSGLMFCCLLICLLNQQVASVLGVSPFFLIGFIALLTLAFLWIAPMFERGEDGDWRYEKRLIRRPGI